MQSYLGTALHPLTLFRCLILPRCRWPGHPEPPRKGCLFNFRYILVLFVMLLQILMPRLTPLKIRSVEDCQLTTQVVKRQFFIEDLRMGNFTGRSAWRIDLYVATKITILRFCPRKRSALLFITSASQSPTGCNIHSNWLSLLSPEMQEFLGLS